MANLNHVILIGRLTRDSELKYTNSGMAVARLSIAVNRRKRSGDQWTEEANFFDITVFGKTAENLSQYLVKGKEIAVEGELRQNRWEQDGQPRSKVEVVANNVQLLGGPKGGETRGSSQSYGNDQVERYTPGGGDDGFEDDIPF
jgi:single-strand DNA-binding protein